MFLYSAQMSMHVAKWIYWWSPNKQSLTTACTQGEKAQWAGFWVKQGENNLKNHEGLNWSWTRARVSKHRASNNKAGRNTTALSVLANEEHQDVPGVCSAMIHTVKLIKRGPWEAFGYNKLLPPPNTTLAWLRGYKTGPLLNRQHTQGHHGLEAAECHPCGMGLSLCQLVLGLPNIQFAQADVLVSECCSQESVWHTHSNIHTLLCQIILGFPPQLAEVGVSQHIQRALELQN